MDGCFTRVEDVSLQLKEVRAGLSVAVTRLDVFGELDRAFTRRLTPSPTQPFLLAVRVVARSRLAVECGLAGFSAGR